MEILKKRADLLIDEHFDHLWKLASYIRTDPEIAFREKKAVHALSSYLQKQGLAMETGIAGLDTVFQIVFKKRNGPRIAVFTEYDTLKGLGYACGHNLVTTSVLGCAAVIKRIPESNELEGSIEVYETPAEENDGGEIITLKQGVFDGLDTASLICPTSAMARIGGEYASFTDFETEYFGKSAHAESHLGSGANALDAANLLYQAAGLVRQQLRDLTHIYCIIAESERDTGRIPGYARLGAEISTMQAKGIETTKQKIANVTEGMALASGCRIGYKEIPRYYGRMPNVVLAEPCRQEMLAPGESMMEGVPSDAGEEDLGNVSRVIPACNLCMTLSPGKRISGYIDQFRELVIPDAGKHCLDISSGTMTNSILTPYQDPKLFKQAKEELKHCQEEEARYE